MSFSRTDTLSASVLIIEEDPLMLTAMGSVLNSAGHRAVMARTETVAMESIEQGEFDAIVLAIDGLETGCQFASRLRCQETTSDTPIIFLVPELSAEWSQSLAAHGGAFSMLKPVQPDALIELVEKALWLPHVAQSRTTQVRKNSVPAPKTATARDWIKL